MGRHKRRRSTARHIEERHRPEHDAEPGKGERLQKVLAAAGVGSRRDCEELIREGRVEIDRQVVTELGTRVDPVRQEIRVDGEALRRPQRLYYAVNKPEGVVTTNFDPGGRPRVIDLVPTEERVFAVGRLDRASEGLILVTNDGEFANRITHPRYGVEKTYLVRVAGEPTTADLDRLKKGVYLSEGFCRVQSITVKNRHGKSTDMVMVLNEGRNRELRRILARVGHKVLRLKRIAVGPIKLADLPAGAWRKLLPAEVENLLKLAKEKRKAGKAKRKGQRPQGAVGNALRGVPSPSSGVPGPSGGAEPVHGQREETPYLQKQALLAQPLSLDDLLRDDLEEGNLAEQPNAGAVGNALRGIPQTDDASELRFSDDARPRAKRGTVIGDQQPPRGRKEKFKPRGKKFAKQRGKPVEHAAGQQASGQKSGRRKFGKHLGKPGGKKFDKPGGKPFAKKFGKQFGKQFGKRRGKGKGRP
jgi:23S rRNA pseudouridine2605 synthase